MENWTNNEKGNFVRRDFGDSIFATVFKNRRGGWSILDSHSGCPELVEADFDIADEAMAYADEILSGLVKCRYVRRRAENTAWIKQKTRSNSAETYGRIHHQSGVSVKRATSGTWYYRAHGDGNSPVGWFATAQQAMAAFDRSVGAV